MCARPESTQGRIFLYAQHLLGTGHLKRAALIADAVAQRRVQVELVSGGMPVAHLGFPVFQLPPVRCAPGDFAVLLDETGRPVDEKWRIRRRRQLVEHFVMLNPDILIIEAFPFDRRQMRFELMPLLAAAQNGRKRPLIIASVRDVVHRRGPERVAETVKLVRRYFDQVLVHGDPAIIPFEASFPAMDQIRDRLTYTGYVGHGIQAYQSEQTAGPPEVLVSAGGGAASTRYFMTAIEARSHSRLRGATWRLLVGDAVSEHEIRRLRERAGPDGVVERARADFPALLARCAVSVSRGGYNTVVDVLRARARAVIVPYVGNGETEQTVRAHWLEKLGYARVLEEDELTAHALATAVDHVAAMRPPPAGAIDLEGAARTAGHLIDALGALRLVRRSP